MALIKCPECGRENVSDSAIACPNCGYAVKEHFEKIIIKDKTANQLKKIQELDFIVPYEKVDWRSVVEENNYTMLRQGKIRDQIVNQIKDLLSQDRGNKDVYRYVLQTALELNENSVKMMRDDKYYAPIYQENYKKFLQGVISVETFTDIQYMDINYMMLAEMQCLYSADLLDCLEPDIVKANTEYQEGLKKICNLYLEMVDLYVLRSIKYRIPLNKDVFDFLVSPARTFNNLIKDADKISAGALQRAEAYMKEKQQAKNSGQIVKPQVNCPYCKSTDVKIVSSSSRILSTLTFGLAGKKIGKQWHCNNCKSDF